MDEALSSLGLPWLAYGAKLLHHAQQVGDAPRLGDLASLYAIYGDACEVHPISGRRDAHVLPSVGRLSPPVGHYLVSLGYEVLYGALQVGEASTDVGCLLLGIFDAIGG